MPVNGAETANPGCKVDTNTPTGKDQNERVDIPNSEVNTDDPDDKDENKRIEVTHENNEQVATNPVQARRYPLRERKPPKYLAEFYTDLNDGNDLAYNSTDYCYKACGVPQTYTEAMSSPRVTEWRQAMEEDMESIKENHTFELTTLPVGKKPVGGKWVYTIKENAEGSEALKARYVAKVYSQVEGIDYQETFAPTANIASVRVLMQLAAQYNLIVHQMDVKTAYLHAPIDQEIFMDQPAGFAMMSEDGKRIVYKLRKSLYAWPQTVVQELE